MALSVADVVLIADFRGQLVRARQRHDESKATRLMINFGRSHDKILNFKPTKFKEL